MRFRSTRGATPHVDLRTALLSGLAPDGGLYLPEAVPHLPPLTDAHPAEADIPAIATAVLAPFCDEAISPATLQTIVRETFDFPIPLVRVDERVAVLELFHGPTLAFKDVGARFLARMLAATRDPHTPLVVLTATSGDTGGAVAAAFRGVEGVHAVVLYPAGRVSPLQERQITTVGGNVHAVSIDGSFDDCQRIVKQAFTDRELSRHVRLTSANSINIGRLLPQMVYYVAALRGIESGRHRVTVSVPSGNLGNLTAGLLARLSGLPVHHFVAATNVNAAFGAYLASGERWDRPAVRTSSSAMDVADPSNLERILTLYPDRKAVRAAVRAYAVSDDDTHACMARTAADTGYVLDPHSAVGMYALRRDMRQDPADVGIVLATAHPAKFPDIVERVVGRRVPEPEALAALRTQPVRSTHLEGSESALRAFVLDVAHT